MAQIRVLAYGNDANFVGGWGINTRITYAFSYRSAKKLV